MPAPSLSNCSIFFNETNAVFAYDFETNTSIDITLYFNTPPVNSDDIAVTTTKLWMYNGLNIQEYNIILSPFSGTSSRNITLPDYIGAGLTSINDTTLISSTKGLNIWLGASDNFVPSKIACTASYENGTQASASTTLATGSTSTSQQIGHLPSSPGDNGWPSYWPTTASLSTYKFNAYSGSAIVATLNYEVVCKHYYEPVRVAYKNRFGQFDFINFYKRHNDTFNTEQRLYQPQIGTWESQTLSYNQFQTSQQRYIVDATQVLECNTDFLQEGYNDLFKQLLVSDEIYWLYDQSNSLVKPLTIQTNSLQFKTGVNNKLIQYTIAFDIGQPYKLLL